MVLSTFLAFSNCQNDVELLDNIEPPVADNAEETIVQFQTPVSMEEALNFCQTNVLQPVDITFQWGNHRGGYKIAGLESNDELERFSAL